MRLSRSRQLAVSLIVNLRARPTSSSRLAALLRRYFTRVTWSVASASAELSTTETRPSLMKASRSIVLRRARDCGILVLFFEAST